MLERTRITLMRTIFLIEYFVVGYKIFSNKLELHGQSNILNALLNNFRTNRDVPSKTQYFSTNSLHVCLNSGSNVSFKIPINAD